MFQGNTKLKISPTTAFSHIEEEDNSPKIQISERKTAFAHIKSLFHTNTNHIKLNLFAHRWKNCDTPSTSEP
jgi:hypothetical protein